MFFETPVSNKGRKANSKEVFLPVSFKRLKRSDNAQYC